MTVPEPPLPPSRACPICYDPLDPADGETFCGTHLYCPDCAARSARAELRQGLVPRCPDCHIEIEPVAAQRILRLEDLERYQRLAVWSNDGVAVCPNCHEGLYADEGDDLSRGGLCRSVCCPACAHQFCIECRNPAHPGILDCDEAERQLHARRSAQRHGATVSTNGNRSSPATPFSCRVAASSSTEHSTMQSTDLATPACSALSSELDEVASAFSELGYKPCPRCRAMVEKLDDESCDHMTCAQCRHEFCWSCLADRFVIYAHGNHFHRPSCRFFAPYGGKLEYLPGRCRRCAHRGTPCVPPACPCVNSPALLSSSSHLGTWFWKLMELLTLRSCQTSTVVA